MSTVQTFVVIGLGQFGRQVAITIAQLGHEVLAVDTDMRRVEEIKDLVARAVRADASQEPTMRALGVTSINTGVVALGEDDFEAAVLAVSVLKELGVARIVARSSNPQRGRILTIVGAQQIVYPEIEMGERVARVLASPGVVDQRTLPSGLSLAEVKIPTPFVGMTVGEAALRAKFGINVLSIEREDGDERRTVDVTPAERFMPGDLLLIVGDRAHIEELCRQK
jgi:trk system potassium uptake protein TrkA